MGGRKGDGREGDGREGGREGVWWEGGRDRGTREGEGGCRCIRWLASYKQKAC